MKNGIVLSMKYSADDEMKKNDYVFNDLIKNKFLGGKDEKTSIKSAARVANGHGLSPYERTGGTELPSK